MYLISYDISDDNLRLKAAKIVLRAGAYRVQYSVFMGTLHDAARRKMENELRKIGQHPRWTGEDSILLLPLHDYTKRELSIIGKTPDDWPLINDELLTLVL